jgi:hypothetical protein
MAATARRDHLVNAMMEHSGLLVADVQGCGSGVITVVSATR